MSARTPRDELADATEHGGLYLRRLLRAQLGLSVLALIAFGGLVGGLPLALFLLPGLSTPRCSGSRSRSSRSCGPRSRCSWRSRWSTAAFG